MVRKEQYLRVARIGKPHGIRGEVTVEVFTDSPELRFTPGGELVVQRPGHLPDSDEVLTVEAWRLNKKIHLLKFTEITDRNTAESYRDVELFAPPAKANDEAWYANELIGLAVYEESLSAPKIGEVTDLISGAAQDLLEVRLLDGRGVLIPFVEQIVPEINEELGAIVITPPPGLLELNQD